MNGTTFGEYATGGLGVVLLVIIVVAALAPVVLSIAARRGVSICVSVVFTFAAGAILLSSRTSIDQVLGMMLYMTALISASVIYAGAMIEAKLSEGRSGPAAGPAAAWQRPGSTEPPARDPQSTAAQYRYQGMLSEPRGEGSRP